MGVCVVCVPLSNKGPLSVKVARIRRCHMMVGPISSLRSTTTQRSRRHRSVVDWAARREVWVLANLVAALKSTK